MAKKKTYREKINESVEKIHDITPEWEEKLGKDKISSDKTGLKNLLDRKKNKPIANINAQNKIRIKRSIYFILLVLDSMQTSSHMSSKCLS